MKWLKNSHFNLKDSQGFTVFELIISIILIGILTVIMIVRFGDLKNSAQTAACRANQQSLNTAQRLYYVIHLIDEKDGHYATDLIDLVPYLRMESMPECPDNGDYMIQPDGYIICNIGSHQLSF